MSADRRREAAIVLALAAIVLLLGVWPWHPIVGMFPHGSDATKWVQSSHPSEPGWFRYVFLSRHFIGYRPVAALTYTIDGLISGWEPWAYRLTDIALHGVVAVLLRYVYRALTGDRSAWGLVPPLVFLLHPVAEEVVPHLARRSYSLSSALALAGLLAFVPAARAPDSGCRSALGCSSARPGRAWLAAAAFLLAMLANEVAGVVVALLPVLALHLRPPNVGAARAVRLAAPSWAAALLLLAIRLPILGDAGGYQKRYFAYAAGGHNLLREVGDAPWLEIAEAALRYALFPSSPSGEAPLLVGIVGLAAVGAVAGAFAWQVGRGGGRDAARLSLVLLAWVAGYALLYALTRNWFWRQGYPMALPLALLFAVVARATLGRRGPIAAVAALPQLALLLSVAWHSPALRGLDRSQLVGPLKMSAAIHDVRETLAAHPIAGPGVVHLALPTRAGNAHMVRIWSERLHDGPLAFRVLAVSAPTAHVGLDDPLLDVRTGDDGPEMRLAPGMEWSDVAVKRYRIPARAEALPLELLAAPATRDWIYWRDGRRGRLAPVPPKRDDQGSR